MSTKKGLTDEELLAQFDTIGGDDADPSSKPSQPPAKPNDSASTAKDEDDPLAELSALAAQRPTSRPATPRRKEVVNTPSSSTASGRTSEDKSRLGAQAGRKSGESAGFQQKFTPRVEDADEEVREREREREEQKAAAAGGAGGGWWGGIFGAASAAMKTGEAFVKDLSKNEEAQKWAERVQGNAMSLRGLGADLRTRALPTFTTLLHTLAPPISSHERLVIHTTHDLVGYPSLSPLIHAPFARVMAQVEGGDLLVLQRSLPSAQQPSSSDAHSAWTDGPWWRQSPSAGEGQRSIGAVAGLVEGSKLCRVSAESFAAEFFAAGGGVEEAARRATEVLSESNPVRSSDIFLALQPVTHRMDKELFAASSSGGGKEEGVVEDAEEQEEEMLSFAVYLHDPIHSIAFATVTQAVPAKWVEWLDASDPAGEGHVEAEVAEGAAEKEQATQLPEEIREIIASGGVDPREWVAEWVEEVLSLGFGIVAQRYVARRMGVGEGGLGRGKMREEMVVDHGAGEAARGI